MELNDYQNKAADTAVYPADHAIDYLTLGLIGEAGEVANKLKKHIRGDVGYFETKDRVRDELGDVLWYLSMLAAEWGFSLDDVAQNNLEKLRSRAERNVIKGSGDER